MTLIDLANPTRFLTLTARVLPWLAGADRHPAADRPLPIGHGARRLPAGRHRQDHVHPRAECVAVDVRLGRDEPGRAGHAGVAASAGGRRRQGRRPDRRLLHVSRAGDGLAVGPADVGHLLGMGCAADLGADPVPDVSRPDRAVARGRRSLARGARRRGADAGRRASTCRSSSSRSTGGTRCISRPRCCGWAGRRSTAPS